MIKILIAVAVLAALGALFGFLQVLRAGGPEPEEAGRDPKETGEEGSRLAAVVHCTGCGSEFTKYRYEGIEDCLAAARMPGGGPLRCEQGCLGMGSCAKVCPQGAIHIAQGAAVVDRDRCDGCGRCAEVCPRKLIALEPFRPKRHVSIPCSSSETGETVEEFCSNGCIGCGLCAKECPREAITVEEGLARIDYEKCDSCGLCVSKCPRHLIQEEVVPEPPKPEPKPEKPPKPPKKPKAPKKPKREKGKTTPPQGKMEEPAEEKEEVLETPSEILEEIVISVEEETAPPPEKEPEEAAAPEETSVEKEEPVVPPAPAETREEKGEDKARMSEEAFKAFEQAVAAVGEALGEKEEAPEEETPAGALAGGEKTE